MQRTEGGVRNSTFEAKACHIEGCSKPAYVRKHFAHDNAWPVKVVCFDHSGINDKVDTYTQHTRSTQ